MRRVALQMGVTLDGFVAGTVIHVSIQGGGFSLALGPPGSDP
jgi:hypothetical protein